MITNIFYAIFILFLVSCRDETKKEKNEVSSPLVQLVEENGVPFFQTNKVDRIVKGENSLMGLIFLSSEEAKRLQESTQFDKPVLTLLKLAGGEVSRFNITNPFEEGEIFFEILSNEGFLEAEKKGIKIEIKNVLKSHEWRDK